MVDKDLCLSSYMAYRYIYKEDMDFYEGMKHKLYQTIPIEDRIPVKTADEIDTEIQKQFDDLYKKYKKIGILLSGGIDSAILATYLKKGSNAYTFSTKVSNSFNLDEERSKIYCKHLGLNQILVNIDFDDYKKYTPIIMKEKCAPVHSIEPQIYKAAMLAKEYGDELIIIGNCSDVNFGGFDKLLSKDWFFDDFVKRFIFLDPNKVLKKPINVYDIFEKYRIENNKIEYKKFLEEVYKFESINSYYNAFHTANMHYCDPYEILVMEEPLDLNRIRNGEAKYLIKELFNKKYPDIPVPDKIPMPRPVDKIFENWEGPTRNEFRKDIPMNELTGNQKWQLWCAELFLNENE